MARRKTRTAENIVWDITVKAMESADTDFVKFQAPNANGERVIEGDDWTVTVRADATHIASGPVPAYITALL